MRFIVIDTETGGVDPNKDALLSIAAIVCIRKLDGTIEQMEEMSVEINPPKNLRVTDQALAKNKLNLEDLRRTGLTEQAALEALLKISSKYRNDNKFPVIVGWNIHFDIGFLTKAFERCDIGWPYMNFNAFDVSMYWKHYHLWQLGRFGFKGIEGAARELLGETIEHDAMADVRSTIKLLEKFLEAEVK